MPSGSVAVAVKLTARGWSAAGRSRRNGNHRWLQNAQYLIKGLKKPRCNRIRFCLIIAGNDPVIRRIAAGAAVKPGDNALHEPVFCLLLLPVALEQVDNGSNVVFQSILSDLCA